MEQIAAKSVESYQTQPESALLGLPAELRNRIYEFSFYGTKFKIGEHSKKIFGTISPLVYLCKQIRAETEAMFWSEVELEVYLLNLKEIARLPDVARTNIKVVRTKIINDWGYREARFARAGIREARKSLEKVGFCSRRAVIQAFVHDGPVNMRVISRSFVLGED